MMSSSPPLVIFFGACVAFPDLSPGLSCCLCLSSHGSLQLNGQFHIFYLHTLHLDAPVVCRVIQAGLEMNINRTDRHGIKCVIYLEGFLLLYIQKDGHCSAHHRLYEMYTQSIQFETEGKQSQPNTPLFFFFNSAQKPNEV